MAYTQVQWARNAGSSLISEAGAAGEVVVDTDDYTLVVRDGATSGGFAAPAKMNAMIHPPHGRLTCTSMTPVMTADVGPATTIYYDPYIGKYAPVYDGSYFRSVPFGEISIGLASGVQLNAHLYDLFVFFVSGTLTLGTGPAWTNNTTRSSGIGLYNGIWSNTGTISIQYGAASGSTASVGTHQATYVGTMYATANGQTLMQFRKAAASGGSAPVLGVWNAYNRVRYGTRSLDSTVSWAYTTATWRQANASGSNQVSWVDGLAQSTIEASYSCDTGCASGTTSVSIGLNSTSTPEAHTPTHGGAATTQEGNLTAKDIISPQIGFNTVTAMENGQGSTTGVFYGNGRQQLTLSLEM